MDEETTKALKKRFDSLPETVKEAIMSSNYSDTLIQIAKKYNFNIEQSGILERETTLVMLGLTPTTSFEEELTRELGIDTLKGSLIVKEINEKIFGNIRDLLKLMNTPKGEEPVVEEEPEATSYDTRIPIRTVRPVNPAPAPLPSKEEVSIMNSAGIKIVPSAGVRASVPSDAGGETREEMLKKVEKPELIGKEAEKLLPGVAKTKLLETFRIPAQKTEYTLSNMSKNNPGTAAKPNIVQPPTKLPGVDPYRTPIDEK